MYRHVTGKKPAYRFVRAPFSVELFQEDVNGSPLFMEGRQLGDRWRSRGVEYSPQLENVVDYRSVIQGDRSLIRKSSDPTLLSRLVMFYSLGGRLNTMSRMHLVTHAILDRNTSIESIHSLVANILRENDLQLPSTSLSRGLTEDVTNVKALYRIEKESEFLRRVVTDGESLTTVQTELDALSLEFAKSLELTSSELEAVEESIRDLVERKREMQRVWELEDLQHSKRFTDTRNEVDSRRTRVNQLLQARDDFDDADAESRRLEQQNLTAYKDDLAEHVRRLEQLEEGVKDLRRDYEERCSQAKERHNKRDREFGQSILKLNNELHALKSQRDEEKRLAEGASHARTAEINYSYQERESELNTRIGELRVHSKQLSETEEEQESIAEAGAALDSISKSLSVSRSQCDSASEAVEEAKRAREEAGRRYTERETTLRKLTQRRDDVADRLRPASGTWLAALHRDQPDWYNGLGRVLRPDVLNDSTLAPSMVDPDSSTIMGWAIDIGRLDKPEWAASIEDLQLQLEMLEEKAADAEVGLEETRRLYQKCQDSVDLASKEYERARQEVSRRNDAAEVAKQTLESIKHECRQSAIARRDEAGIQLKIELASQVKLVKDRESEVEAEQQSLSERKNEINGQYAIDISDKENAIRTTTERQENGFLKLKETLSGLDRDYQELCTGQGLDELVMKRVRAAAKEAAERVDQVTNDRDFVNGFTQWLNNEWSQYGVLTERLAKEEAVLREVEADLHRSREKHEHRKVQIQREQIALESNRSAKASALQIIREWIGKLPVVAARSVANEGIEVSAPRDVRLLDAEARRLSGQADALKKSIRKGVNRAEGIFYDGMDKSRLREAWEALRIEVRASLVDPDDMDALQLKMTLAIERLLHDQVPQMREGGLLAVVNAGFQLAEFFRGLKQAQDQIKRQSREISRAITGKMHFKAISDVQIHLISRIEQHEFWPELERFTLRWDEWESSRGLDLPPLDLCEMLVNMSHLVSRSGLSDNIEEIFSLQISLTENGQPVVARNSSDMEALSSNGLAYLVLMSIYAGITRMLCTVPEVSIHWPVDELAVLHVENITALFNMLDELGIIMVGGFPSTERSLLQFFKHHHGVMAGQGILEFRLSEDRLDRLLAGFKSHSPKEVV